MTTALSAACLRRSPSFLRLTGIFVAVLDGMLAPPRANRDAEETRRIEPGRTSDIGGLEDHLLVMFAYYRCYITQGFLGFFYRLHKKAQFAARSRGSKRTPSPDSVSKTTRNYALK